MPPHDSNSSEDNRNRVLDDFRNTNERVTRTPEVSEGESAAGDESKNGRRSSVVVRDRRSSSISVRRLRHD